MTGKPEVTKTAQQVRLRKRKVEYELTRWGASGNYSSTARYSPSGQESPLMKTKSPYAIALAFFASFLILMPRDSVAERQAGGQTAGEVSRVLPAVSMPRGAKLGSAAA